MLKKTCTGLVVSVLLAGCTTTDPYTGQQKVSDTTKGAAIGAGIGALGGLLVGGSHNAQRNAVLIGAGLGALGGGVAGKYMDDQESALRNQLQGSGISVTRYGDRIVLNMPDNVTFNTDEDSIKSKFYRQLNSIALVLKKYNKSLVDVYGYTDSTGSASYNLSLSQRRASSVASYLNSQGVDGRRLLVAGYGEKNPIASNSTAAGRAQNRRVEIQISPLRSN